MQRNTHDSPHSGMLPLEGSNYLFPENEEIEQC